MGDIGPLLAASSLFLKISEIYAFRRSLGDLHCDTVAQFRHRGDDKMLP